jgi:hypothetical protein
VFTWTPDESQGPSTNLIVVIVNDNGSPSLSATNGVFNWTPGIADAYITHNITVRVADDGAPPLSDEKTFLVTVMAGPVIESINVSNDVVTVTWSAIAGLTYKLQFKTNITDTNWSAVPPDVTATGSSVTNTDTLSTEVERYYRVLLVP